MTALSHPLRMLQISPYTLPATRRTYYDNCLCLYFRANDKKKRTSFFFLPTTIGRYSKLIRKSNKRQTAYVDFATTLPIEKFVTMRPSISFQQHCENIVRAWSCPLWKRRQHSQNHFHASGHSPALPSVATILSAVYPHRDFDTSDGTIFGCINQAYLCPNIREFRSHIFTLNYVLYGRGYDEHRWHADLSLLYYYHEYHLLIGGIILIVHTILGMTLKKLVHSMLTLASKIYF